MQLEFGGRRYLVAAGDLVIGSGPESTLVLAAPGVLARHALVRPLGDGLAVVVPAAPGAEILVNGARLGGDPIPLMHGDKIGIGGLEVAVADPRRSGETIVREVAAPVASAAPPATEGPRLVSLTDGREYPVSVVPFSIGRDATCEVVVEAEEVSRLHAQILALDDGDTLVDLSSNGTLLNGTPIPGRAPLATGDVIRVGPEELRYYAAEKPPGAGRLSDTVLGMPAVRRPPPVEHPFLAPSHPPLASLLVRSGERKGERLQVRTPVANLGRAEFNDLKLPDPSVSASHAKLTLREGVWSLADLGSTNGTRVDGELVTEETALSPGATIALGEVRLFFEPTDSGAVKPSGTSVLEVPLPMAPPPSPLEVVRAIMPSAGSRRPTRRRGHPVATLLAVVIGIVLLVLATYFLLR
jgi:pSer/pThr/pTyr-binding forkhead associated (FHA) protein